ncbi:putative magnesium transporter NIPA [Helianthus debilis subsp. tardiflorus]
MSRPSIGSVHEDPYSWLCCGVHHNHSNAPQERLIESVTEVCDLATKPAFVQYATLVLMVVVIVFHYIPW